MIAPLPGGADPKPSDPLLPNAWLVAKREFRERVRSRLFVVSTLLLAGLAVLVALTPVLIRFADRGTTTHVAVVTNDRALAQSSIALLDSLLNPRTGDGAKVDPYSFELVDSDAGIVDAVAVGRYDAALGA